MWVYLWCGEEKNKEERAVGVEFEKKKKKRREERKIIKKRNNKGFPSR
jgi:CRISPR/Cas system CMR-associated protein Cmr3 (group 5 of RAMP superfamily)